MTSKQYAEKLIAMFGKKKALLCIDELIAMAKLYDIEILFSYQPFLSQTKQFIETDYATHRTQSTAYPAK